MTTQTEQNYTSGPWEAVVEDAVEYDAPELWTVRPVNRFDNKHCICHGCGYEEIEEAEANAQLIAAAPELLEACKSALNNINGIQDYRKTAHTIKKIQRAINLAEGKE